MALEKLFESVKDEYKKVNTNPNSYYNIQTLLSKKDLNNETPEIFVACGNRSSGKTTSVNREVLSGWKDGTVREIMFLKRYSNEIKGTAQNILNLDFLDKFFPDWTEIRQFKEYKIMDGSILRVRLGMKTLFWVVAVNCADKVKKNSSLFNKVDAMVFDEFMPETGTYCSNEVDKLKSIHVSVARGMGMRSRYVPLIMMSNLVSIVNPYFVQWGFSSRINTSTRFIRGNGIVLEQNFNKEAAREQASSRFLSAFGDNEYYTEMFTYLDDDISFVGKIKGASSYLATIAYKGKYYGMKLTSENLLYFDSRPDMQHQIVLACTPTDYEEGFRIKQDMPSLFLEARDRFSRGMCRFENQEVKDVAFKFILS